MLVVLDASAVVELALVTAPGVRIRRRLSEPRTVGTGSWCGSPQRPAAVPARFGLLLPRYPLHGPSGQIMVPGGDPPLGVIEAHRAGFRLVTTKKQPVRPNPDTTPCGS